MTTAAREALEDAREAVAELIDGLQGRLWRRRWFAAVALLRTVGYVLRYVDRKKGQKYQAAIDVEWRKLQAEPLFVFLKTERDNIIKEYRHSAGQGATVDLWGKTTKHHYPINSGPYKDRDQRDVLREVITLWERYLDAVDKTAGAP
jgi:hypothetical protein